jgi:hypothetical protein
MLQEEKKMEIKINNNNDEFETYLHSFFGNMAEPELEPEPNFDEDDNQAQNMTYYMDNKNDLDHVDPDFSSMPQPLMTHEAIQDISLLSLSPTRTILNSVTLQLFKDRLKLKQPPPLASSFSSFSSSSLHPTSYEQYEQKIDSKPPIAETLITTTPMATTIFNNNNRDNKNIERRGGARIGGGRKRTLFNRDFEPSEWAQARRLQRQQNRSIKKI